MKNRIGLFVAMLLWGCSTASANPTREPLQAANQSAELNVANITTTHKRVSDANIQRQDSLAETTFCGPPSFIVRFHEHINAGGDHAVLTSCPDSFRRKERLEDIVGRGPLGNSNWNDEISSVYFYKGYRVRVALWENHDFRGNCILLQGSQGRIVNLSDFGWNDRASSIAYEPPRDPPYTGPPFNCKLIVFDQESVR